MNDDVDEFSFLAAQAADLGSTSPLPRGERLALRLPDGRTLSALRYEPSNETSAPAITLLHGAGLNAHTWDTTVLALGLPVLSIDLPGHGDSSWRSDLAYTGRALAADVAVGIAEWTSRPQILVGHSLGGLTAAAVAASHPDLVRELVVIDITPGVDPNAGPTQIREFFAGPTDWATRDELVERALSFGLGGSRRAAERGVFLNSRIRADGRVEWKHHFAHLAAAAAAADPTDKSPHQDAVAGVLSQSGWDDLATVTSPITLIRGTHGYVTEANAAEFHERVPSASLIALDSGHNVQEELPAALADVLVGIAGKG